MTKRGKKVKNASTDVDKENICVEIVNNKSNKNLKTKIIEKEVGKKASLKKEKEKTPENKTEGEKEDIDVSKNGESVRHMKNKKDLKLEIEESKKNKPSPLSENEEVDQTELDTPLLETEENLERPKTNGALDDAGDSLADILDNLIIDENKDFVRRSVRRTASEILKEETEKINLQLRKDNDDNLGIEVKMFPGKGRGVVTTRDRVKGEFVVEYAGDIINLEDANNREAEYSGDVTKGCYMYYFKYQDAPYCVDGTAETGRLGRLLNHSCVQPNLQTKIVSLDDHPRLILVAKHDIAKGTELVYDYGDRDKETIKAHPWLSL